MKFDSAYTKKQPTPPHIYMLSYNYGEDPVNLLLSVVLRARVVGGE